MKISFLCKTSFDTQQDNHHRTTMEWLANALGIEPIHFVTAFSCWPTFLFNLLIYFSNLFFI